MNFPPFSHLDLQRQRDALARAERALKNQQEWFQKREEIEKNIFQLQEEIKQEFYQRHQKGTFQEEDTKRFQQIIEEKYQHLHQLQKSQMQVDEWLDQIEDLTEESLQQQRLQLLHAMWQFDPAKREEQEPKWKEWNQLRILEIELLKIEKILERISDHLNIAIRARQSIKGRGILNYIFGVSPNLVIERQLLGIHHLILNSFPLFEQHLHQNLHSSFHQLFLDVFTLFEELKNTCDKPWSFRHLDAFFSKTEPQLQQLSKQSQQQKNQIMAQIQRLNEEIEQWIREL